VRSEDPIYRPGGASLVRPSDRRCLCSSCSDAEGRGPGRRGRPAVPVGCSPQLYEKGLLFSFEVHSLADACSLSCSHHA
jgi:hypothetical protein